MSKLSDKQRKKIIAEYVAGDGKVSMRALAKKYKVSPTSISKILGDKKSVQKCTHKKKENEMSMLAFLDSKSAKAQEIIESVLSTFDLETLKKASVRERAGLLKILAETFGEKNDRREDEQERKLDELIGALSGRGASDE